MAGAACKIIINNGVGGLTKALEQILSSQLVRDTMLEASICDDLIDRLARVDLAAYNPERQEMPKGGLRGIVLELIDYEVLTEEVLEIYSR